MLKPFYIIFYKGTSPISRLIKIITKSKKYTHVALVLDNFHTLELDWKTPLSIKHFSYKKENYDIYRLKLDLSEHEKELILLYLKERINTRYDWKFIISRFFNYLINTPIINSESNYNCDEILVDAFKNVLGIDLLEQGIKMSPHSLSESFLLEKVEDS